MATKTINWTKPTCATPKIERVKNRNQFKITCETEGARIYYTTDGTTPRPNDWNQIYIDFYTYNTITKSVTVKAIAVKDGYNDSWVATEYIYYSSADK